MNGFDEVAARRALLARHFIPTWLQLRYAITDCVNSYNRLAEGREHSAVLAPVQPSTEAESPIVVSCHLGRTKEEGYLLTVSVKVSYKHGNYQIDAEIHRWLQPPDSAPKQYRAPRSMHFEFKAELGDAPGSGVTWLEYEGNRLTVAKVAHTIMGTALLQDEAEIFQA